MESLTQRFSKYASARARSADPVDQIMDYWLAGETKEASRLMATLDQSQTIRLNQKMAEYEKRASDPEVGDRDEDVAPIAKDRDEAAESESRNEARPADETTDFDLGEGLGPGLVDQTPPESPEFGNTEEVKERENEILREPKGDADKKEIKMAALRKKLAGDMRKGVKDGQAQLKKLARKKAKLDLLDEYGEAFAKVAAEYSQEDLTEETLRNHAEGIKDALRDVLSNGEVKMGSLKKLYEEQEKVANSEDFGKLARQMGRAEFISKLAQLQALEEAAIAEPPVVEAPAEVADQELAEAVSEVEALVEQAIEAPETLTDEEAEIVLELEDAMEDIEAQALGGEDKITKVTDIIAALRYYGYGN